MSKKFDPTKPVQTRGGYLARIICTNKEVSENYNFPIVALIKLPTDVVERIEAYTSKGYYSASEVEHSLDLINIPEEKIGWINVYSSTKINHAYAGEVIFSTKEEAEKDAYSSNEFIVHTIKITWRE